MTLIIQHTFIAQKGCFFHSILRRKIQCFTIFTHIKIFTSDFTDSIMAVEQSAPVGTQPSPKLSSGLPDEPKSVVTRLVLAREARRDAYMKLAPRWDKILDDFYNRQENLLRISIQKRRVYNNLLDIKKILLLSGKQISTALDERCERTEADAIEAQEEARQAGEDTNKCKGRRREFLNDIDLMGLGRKGKKPQIKVAKTEGSEQASESSTSTDSIDDTKEYLRGYFEEANRLVKSHPKRITDNDRIADLQPNENHPSKVHDDSYQKIIDLGTRKELLFAELDKQIEIFENSSASTHTKDRSKEIEIASDTVNGFRQSLDTNRSIMKLCARGLKAHEPATWPLKLKMDPQVIEDLMKRMGGDDVDESEGGLMINGLNATEDVLEKEENTYCQNNDTVAKGRTEKNAPNTVHDTGAVERGEKQSIEDEARISAVQERVLAKIRELEMANRGKKMVV